uniref:Uncharacterized protein n=1 Tax=Brassica oleracea var. oleracea TaxID=109376 RepID=A0A0D3D3G4_BRAOL
MIYSSNCRCSVKASRIKKLVTGLWDLNIPSELLQEILSRLGPKGNIIASTVCKTWFEAAVSVRKFHPIPWLFYRNPAEESRFFSGKCLAFSAAPTSTSCLVVSFTQFSSKDPFVISTWRHGETSWTIHLFKNQPSSGKWLKCVFSNGVFYGFSDSGYVGAFHPCSATWDVLPVKPWACPTFCRQIDFRSKNVLLMEHNGNIFGTENKSSVFKPNLERMVWEEKSEVSGLTIFTRYPDSFSGSKRDTKYPSTNELLSQYYSLVDEKSSCPLTSTSLSKRVAWVDPPHNNFTF